MWFNRRYKAVGLVGTPFYLLTEVLAPAFEVLGIVALVGAIALGLFEPLTFVAMVAAIAFINAALTASAILFEDLQSRSYRKRDLARCCSCTRRSTSSSTGRSSCGRG